jgi:hypothetical protein
MISMKMSWHTNGRLASGWIKSDATESYHPAWLQSSYPSESGARRRSHNRLSTLSTFGKPRYDFGKRNQ